MPTKAELEEELAALKRELEARRADVANSTDGDADPGLAADAAEDPSESATLDRAVSQLDGSELDTLFKQFSAELADMQEQKPLMTLFGAFVLGFVLGRVR